MAFHFTPQGRLKENNVPAACPACGMTDRLDYKTKRGLAAFEDGNVYAEFPHTCEVHSDMPVTLWVRLWKDTE